MTNVARARSGLDLVVIAVIVILAAAIAMAIVGGPGIESSFDLTTDPATGLWSW